MLYYGVHSEVPILNLHREGIKGLHRFSLSLLLLFKGLFLFEHIIILLNSEELLKKSDAGEAMMFLLNVNVC